MTIHLVGPGGAGKSTIGALLAKVLDLSFIDLDQCFFERAGSISAYLERCFTKPGSSVSKPFNIGQLNTVE